MKRNIIETIFGGVVLAIAVTFLMFVYSSSNIKTVDGFNLIAKFSNVNGIAVGSDVTIGGFKVGSVSNIDIEDDFFVKTTLTIKDSLKDRIPYDSIATVSSPGLMGNKLIAIEAGFEEEFLHDGDEITNTQSGASLEQLLGQVIFSLKDKGDKNESESN
ncbi:MAG: MlaD family protein [Alphaproteobacteria bacterium]|nr:MlaD family protein [Alphaproteobacteria bacterium]